MLCTSGLLSGFAWALLASLAGCVYAIVSQWGALIRTLVPERSTWVKSICAGILLSSGLVLLGSSMNSPGWSPTIILAVGFISWSRALWRRVFVGDTLSQTSEKLGALLVLSAAVVFIYPELSRLFATFQKNSFSTWNISLSAPELSKFPRTLAFSGALLLGAASSLQTPQQRTISSHIFWTIPTAISALVLSLSGWVALQLSPSHSALMGQFHSHSGNNLLTLSPAILFGLVMLGLRPQLHIRNTLRIGRDATHWWQLLGLVAGIIVCLALFSDKTLTILDVGAIISALGGHIIFLKGKNTSVRFAPALSAVASAEPDQPRIQSLQN